MLVNSRLEVRNQEYRRFTATVGVNDSARNNSDAATFTAYGDGKVLATNQPIKWGHDGQQLSVDVSPVKIIELVARATTDDSTTLPVTWAEAALLSR